MMHQVEIERETQCIIMKICLQLEAAYNPFSPKASSRLERNKEKITHLWQNQACRDDPHKMRKRQRVHHGNCALGKLSPIPSRSLSRGLGHRCNDTRPQFPPNIFYVCESKKYLMQHGKDQE